MAGFRLILNSDAMMNIAGRRNKNWINQPPNGINNDRIPKIDIMNESPAIQVIVKGITDVIPVIFFKNLKKKSPQAQQTSEI